MLFSIDHGNYAIKTPTTSFPAGLAEYPTRPPLAADTIEYEGRHYALIGQRIPYMRDKTRDDRYFILTLFAIAKELQATGVATRYADSDIAVGLPPEHYSVLRERFTDYFKRGRVELTYNDTPHTLNVRNVFVYPQAFAAVAPKISEIKDEPRMFIVDIGGYTVDVLMLRNGKPDLQFCRSLELGVITMINHVIGRVGSLHDLVIEDEHIVSVLRGMSSIFTPDVIKTIDVAARQHTDSILDKLRELKVDLRSTPAIFIGGGSMLFRPYIETSRLVAKPTFITDPCANAVGYKLLAEGQLQRLANVI